MRRSGRETGRRSLLRCGRSSFPAARSRLHWSRLRPPSASPSGAWVAVILARGIEMDATDPAIAARDRSTRYGVRFDHLADGSLVATFCGSNAVDQAERAARVARAVASTKGARVAVATGMTELRRGASLGEAMDRAAMLLDRDVLVEGVSMDRITARLVEARADPTGHLERSGDPAFVGRARELALLEAIYDECASEPR
jgi:eukaryotic-like serine/threonine-protein kinase